MNADLACGTLSILMSSDAKAGILANVFDALGDHQRRSARNVKLSVVVLFNDLNVGIGESRRRAFGKRAENRNTEGHIGTEKYGNRLCRISDEVKLFLSVPRCGKYNGYVIVDRV
jgi:hypothetical protein